jgi:hypothetical protein
MDGHCRNADDISKQESRMWIDDTFDGQRDLVLCINHAWRYFDTKEQVKSAEFVNVASSNLIAAFKFNPANFLKIMDQHPWLLKRWLRDIEYDIYTWHEDPPCEFVPQIESTRSALESVPESLKHSSSFAEMEAKFKDLSCRQID